MKASQLLFLTILLSLFSCSKNGNPVPFAGELNLINFADLKVGDSFQYSLFLGENYFDENNQNFEYTDDYLNIQVIKELPNGFKVREWIDESSNMLTTDENYYFRGKNEEYTNNWIIDNSTIRIESEIGEYVTSHLFVANDLTFSLDEFRKEKIEITSWKTNDGSRESNADFYVEDFELLDNEYSHLNVVVRNEPMAGDGNGNTYLYSEDAGFVRIVTYSAWTGQGQGWDRVR